MTENETEVRPYLAHYWRHHVKYAEPAGTLAEALAYLASGADSGGDRLREGHGAWRVHA